MLKKTLRIILISIFILGFVLAFTGRILCIDSPKSYREKQDEIKKPEEISDVWVGADKIYLCYRMGTCVNVYDRDGEFLWAVSAPYMKNARFLLTETELIIFGKEAFVYDVENGGFKEVRDTDGLADALTPPEGGGEELPPQAGDLIFNWYSVSELQADGSLKTLIDRPDWYWIFNFYMDLVISALAAMGVGIITLTEKAKAWAEVKESGTLTHPEAKSYRLAILITVGVNAAATILNIFLCSTTVVALLSTHFVIGGVIMYNLIENLSCTEYEKRMFDLLKAVALASYTLLFLTLSFCF